MRHVDRRILQCAAIFVVVLATLAACGPGRPDAAQPSTGASGAVDQSRRPSGTLKVVWAIEPDNLHMKLGAAGPLSSYHWLFNSVLVYRDFEGRAYPMIAREIPSQERGGWVVNADRLQGPIGETADAGGITWNVFDWTLTP